MKDTVTPIFVLDKANILHFVFSVGGVVTLDTSLGDSVCPFEYLDLKFLIKSFWLSKQWSLLLPARVVTLQLFHVWVLRNEADEYSVSSTTVGKKV